MPCSALRSTLVSFHSFSLLFAHSTWIAILVLFPTWAHASPPTFEPTSLAQGSEPGAPEASSPIIRRDVLEQLYSSSPADLVSVLIALRGTSTDFEPRPQDVSGPRLAWHAVTDAEIEPRAARIEQTIENHRARLEDLCAEIRRLGGVVQGARAWGGLVVAVLPVDAVFAIASHPEVLRIDGISPLEGRLDVCTIAIRADTYWTHGIYGVGTDVALVDTGIESTHPAFVGLTIVDGVFLDAAGIPGIDDTPDDRNGHGTHMAGIVVSDDSVHGGVSPGATRLYNVKASYDPDGISGGTSLADPADIMDGIDWAVTQPVDPADVVLLPYGLLALEDDSALARYVDAVVDSLDVSVVMAAGNLGSDLMMLDDPAIAYNGITVGALDVGGTADRSDDAIFLTSSRGPTPGGRRKPDLTAPGVFVSSANHDFELPLAEAFVERSGTSVAAAHVAGAVSLVCEQIGPHPLAAKALLVNSAEDAGDPGWDASYGWGMLDLEAAYANASNVWADSIDPAPDDRLYVGSAALGACATIVWNRHVEYAGGSDPVAFDELADLDLHLYSEADQAAIGSDTTSIDNVHQVSSSIDGAVVVRVESRSESFAGPSQDYVLAADMDLQPLDVDDLTASISTPTIVAPTQTFIVRADIFNGVGATLHDVAATLELPPGAVLESGANPVVLNDLATDSQVAAFWSVTSPDDWGGFDLDVTVDSNSYDVAFEASMETEVLLGRGDSIGLYYPEAGSFFMRDTLVSGTADYTLRYGPYNRIPVTGDFDGDGRDSMGIYDAVNGVFFLRNDISRGNADVVVRFGSGDVAPLIGDWNGDGVDTVGYYDRSTGTFCLRNSNTAGDPDHEFRFGPVGWEPIVGDWDGDGDDTVGLYDGSEGCFFLRNDHGGGPAQFTYRFGPAGDFEPLAGDWNDDGVATIGIYVPHTGVYYLVDEHGSGVADHVVRFGAKRRTPIVGDWDGK